MKHSHPTRFRSRDLVIPKVNGEKVYWTGYVIPPIYLNRIFKNYFILFPSPRGKYFATLWHVYHFHPPSRTVSFSTSFFFPTFYTFSPFHQYKFLQYLFVNLRKNLYWNCTYIRKLITPCLCFVVTITLSTAKSQHWLYWKWWCMPDQEATWKWWAWCWERWMVKPWSLWTVLLCL